MDDLSLGCAFSGIGNFERGLAAAGYAATWQIEADPFRREILKLRFGIDAVPDIREATGMPKVRAMCGGFPCQDLSGAGRGAGIHGSRSSLWGEYRRLIAEGEPETVFIENVPPLLYRGFDVVVADLVELGYSVEWDCVPAAAVGAPQLRDRVWIVARRGASEPSVFGDPVGLFEVEPSMVAGSDWRRWPRAGFATDPDRCLALDPVAPLAAVKDGAGWAWPTPDASVSNLTEDLDNWEARREREVAKGRNGNGFGMPLAVAARMWPTPRRQDGRHGPATDYELSRDEGKDLLHVRVARMWPTPNARDHKDTGEGGYGRRQLPEAVRESEMWPTPRASDADRGGRGDLIQAARGNSNPHFWPTPHGMPKEGQRRRPGPTGNELGRAVGSEEQLWPTPTSSNRDSAGGSNSRKAAKEKGTYASGSLNPDWVEALMLTPVGWTDLDCANEDLRHAPPPVRPGEEPPPEEPPRLAQGVERRVKRLSALGDSLVAQVPYRLGISLTPSSDGASVDS